MPIEKDNCSGDNNHGDNVAQQEIPIAKKYCNSNLAYPKNKKEAIFKSIRGDGLLGFFLGGFFATVIHLILRSLKGLFPIYILCGGYVKYIIAIFSGA
ncbi:MAG: hypothetical protein KOO63_05690 [Bacteroidales bacterium]|nr:hypothetical protein [Candidatus Latescibacterota bacterium]